MSLVTTALAEVKKILADIEAAILKDAPAIEDVFADAAKIEPYIAIFYPELNIIPGLDNALAAMPTVIKDLTAALQPGQTLAEVAAQGWATIEAAAGVAEETTSGGANTSVTDAMATLQKIYNNMVSAAESIGLVATTQASPTPAGTA